MRKILLALAIVACASACTHNVVADDVAVQNESIFDYAPAAADIRLNVAHQTCEANYDGDIQN